MLLGLYQKKRTLYEKISHLTPLIFNICYRNIFILISQAITKEVENTIIYKNSFVEERIDDIWTIEEGMMGSSKLHHNI